MRRLLCLLLSFLLLLGACAPAPEGEPSVTATTAPATAAPTPAPTPQPTPEPTPAPVPDPWEGALLTDYGDSSMEYYLDERLPDALKDAVARNRAQSLKAFDENAMAQVERYRSVDYDEQQDLDVLEALSRSTQSLSILTQEQALEEISFLFGYLKVFYAAYGYLGGDDVFLPVRDALMAGVRAMQEPIAREEYHAALVDRLAPVVVDCHFKLGGTSFKQFHTYQYQYWSEELTFDQVDGDFVTRIDGREYRLVRLNGGDPKERLKLIIDAQGQVKWAPVVLTKQELESMELAFELAAQDGTITTVSALLKACPESNVSGGMASLKDKDGVPVLYSRRMWLMSDESDSVGEAMIETGATLRGEPVFLIDLRNNGGGSDHYAMQWMRAFTGDPNTSQYPTVAFSRITHTSKKLGNFGYEVEPNSLETPGWASVFINEPDLALNRDSLVVVLVNGGVASSGEGFVKQLMNMENVIFVGRNTMGCSIAGNCVTIKLPLSGLELYCGFTLFLETDLSPIEGVGHLPDLWAPPAHAVDRAMLFLKAYGII